MLSNLCNPNNREPFLVGISSVELHHDVDKEYAVDTPTNFKSVQAFGGKPLGVDEPTLVRYDHKVEEF